MATLGSIAFHELRKRCHLCPQCTQFAFRFGAARTGLGLTRLGIVARFICRGERLIGKFSRGARFLFSLNRRLKRCLCLGQRIASLNHRFAGSPPFLLGTEQSTAAIFDLTLR